MPEYRNDGAQGHMVINTAGSRVLVAPGESVETYRIYDLDGLTKTADTPRYNPMVANNMITAAGAEDIEVAVGAETDNIAIINKDTSDVTVFWGSADNTPGTVVPGETVRTFSEIKGLAAKLVVRTTGVIATGKLFVMQTL